MIQAISSATSLIGTRIPGFWRDQKGAVAWEYLLVIAGVSVAIVSAVALGAPGLTDQVILATCQSIDTVVPATMTC